MDNNTLKVGDIIRIKDYSETTLSPNFWEYFTYYTPWYIMYSGDKKYGVATFADDDFCYLLIGKDNPNFFVVEQELGDRAIFLRAVAKMRTLKPSYMPSCLSNAEKFILDLSELLSKHNAKIEGRDMVFDIYVGNEHVQLPDPIIANSFDYIGEDNLFNPYQK